MNTEELIAILRRDRYCLVTDNSGVEPKVDESGNMLVCNPESADLMPVPNVDAIRQLYDLRERKCENTEKTRGTILNIKTSCIDKSYVPDVEEVMMPVPDAIQTVWHQKKKRDNKRTGDSRDLVWLGQRSLKCIESSKLLINLVDSDLYKRLMNNKNVVKLKVWELIGKDIESRGYKIAFTPKEVALRTFQKWRNLERTYWRFRRGAPEDVNQKYPKKKKPYFFEDIHNVLSSRGDYAKKYELFCGKRGLKEGGDGGSENQCPTFIDVKLLSDDNTHSLSKDSKGESNENEDPISIDIEFDEVLCDEISRDSIHSLVTGTAEKNQEAPPKEAIRLLVYLASKKYRYLKRSTNIRGIKFWERIYDEILARGYGFATTRREGAMKLRKHWNENKRLLKRQYSTNMPSASTSVVEETLLEDKGEGSSVAGSKKGDEVNLGCSDNYFEDMQCDENFPDDTHTLLSTESIEDSNENQDPSNNDIELEKLCEETSRDSIQSLATGTVKKEQQTPPEEELNLSASLSKETVLEHNDKDSSVSDESLCSPNVDQNNEEVVTALLQLLNTPHFYKLSQNYENFPWVWEKIYYQLESMGLHIAGPTVRAKSKILYKTWKSLKRSFMKYERDKSRGLSVEKPAHSDLLLNIVYGDVISKRASKPGDMDSKDFVNPTLDHDYNKSEPSFTLDAEPLDEASTSTQHIRAPVSTSTTCTQANLCCTHTGNSADSECRTTFTALGQQSTTNGQSDNSNSALKKMLSQNLAAQQENFDKVISLLTEQLNQQKTLNALVLQYITNLLADQARKKANRQQKKLERQNAKNTSNKLYDFFNNR